MTCLIAAIYPFRLPLDCGHAKSHTGTIPHVRHPPLDTDRYDFFVSYARADNQNGLISTLVDKITHEFQAFTGRPPEVFFDTAEIHHGHDWRHTLQHGVEDSRAFIAFVSPAYLNSEWCLNEWRAWVDTEILKHVFSNGARPLLVVPVPGTEAGTPDHIKQLLRRQFVDLHQYCEGGLNPLYEAALQSTLKILAQDIHATAERVRQAALSVDEVPAYNRNFTGRVNELLNLREILLNRPNGIVSGLSGLGGIGKTELAFTYSWAFAEVYPGGRFLVPCEGKASLTDAILKLDEYADFHPLITTEERLTAASLFPAIMRCLTLRLRAGGSILLVLDNVTAPEILHPAHAALLAKPGLHLLMTTRLVPPAGSNFLPPLTELPPDEAVALMRKFRDFGSEAELAAAHRIVKKLGGFPLAVELVAAWLAEHPEGATYRSVEARLDLEMFETEIADDSGVVSFRHNHEKSLKVVLGYTLAALTETERHVMEFAAFLPPDSVALPWLRGLVAGDALPALVPEGSLADRWAEAVDHLKRLALFSRGGEDSRLVRVHRLVQDVVRAGMPAGRVAECEGALSAFVRQRAPILDNAQNLKQNRWEFEPFGDLALLWAHESHKDEKHKDEKHKDESHKDESHKDESHQQAAWLLNQAGKLWHAANVWTRAEPLMRRALEIDEESYGVDHPNVAIRLNNLAQLLQATNRMSEAEPLMRRALEIDEESYGVDHPDVAIDLNNLAALLQATNRMSEAEPLMRRMVQIFLTTTRATGHQHPHLRTVVMNYYYLLAEMGLPTDQLLGRLGTLGPEPLSILQSEIDPQKN